MKTLDRKLLRDLRLMWSQALTIALVVASAIGGFITTLSAVDSLALARDQFYATGHFADVFATVKRAPNALGEVLREVEGVADVQTTIEQIVRIELSNVSDPVVGQLIGLDLQQQPRMNLITLRAGKPLADTGLSRLALLETETDTGLSRSALLETETDTGLSRSALLETDSGLSRLALLEIVARNDSNEIQALVSPAFAKARGLSAGSRVGALINGKHRQLVISGIALSPEFIFSGLFGMPDQRGFGVFWVDKKTLAAFIVRAGRAALTPIEVNARNGEFAWIRAGIASGEQVIIYPSAAVHDGARVVARVIQN
jgi:putative ABC transport system permease protein